MEVIVEHLGTSRNVLERHRFAKDVITIGRALDNDVILNDEHVDSHHAHLVSDIEGRVRIEDLGTVNGLRRPRHRHRVESAEVESGDVFVIGRSRIRVYRADHPVPPAVRIRLSELFLLWLGKPRIALMLATLFLATRAVDTWLSTVGDFKWSMLVQQNLSGTLFFVVLAVGVYLLSVLFRRGGHLVAHLSLLMLLLLVTSILEFVHGVAVFNAGDRLYPALEWSASIRSYLLFFVYLWSILYLAFHLPLLRRTVIAGAVAIAWIGIDNLPENSRLLLNSQPSFPLQQTLLPPQFLLADPLGEDEFSDQSEKLFGQIDKERVKALQERECDECEDD